MSITTHHTWRALQAPVINQEAVMGQPISRQHPAVVLRSHYQHMRSLLAVALIAVVALSATVVILATEDDGETGTTVSSESFGSTAGFQNRPDEGTVAQSLSNPSTPAAATRPDESAVASAIATPSEPPTVARPDESKVAASIALGQQRSSDGQGASIEFRRQWPQPDGERPDEGTVAQAVSGR
jgi:hypothetical protein